MTSLSDVLRKRHLPALDGLRAVAVGVVMLSHDGISAVPGDLGVTAFFVLSGFLITWLLLKERERTGGVSLRAFYLRRALRIFPAYLAFIGLSIGMDAFLGTPWAHSRILAALTYTINYQNAFNGHTGPAAHAWSLAVEEQFYLLWPLLMVLLGPVKRARVGLVALIIAVCAWRSFLFLGMGAPDSYVYNAFDTRFDSLAIGCLLAMVAASPGFLRAAHAVARRAWYPLPVVAAIYVSRELIGSNWHYSAGFTVDSLLVAVLITQLLQLSSTRGWSWLNSRFAVWMGALSYPLYLWHAWGLSAADNITGTEALLPNLVVGVILSFILASCSYYGIEKYFLGIKDRLTRARQPGSVSLDAAPASRTS